MKQGTPHHTNHRKILDHQGVEEEFKQQAEILRSGMAKVSHTLTATRSKIKKGNHTMDSWSALQAWPIACVSASGEILYATAKAQAALANVSDPGQTLPVWRLGKDLMEKIKQAVNEDHRTGVCTLFRRDGQLGDYTLLVKSMELNSERVLSLMLIDGDLGSGSFIDNTWFEIFGFAVCENDKGH